MRSHSTVLSIGWGRRHGKDFISCKIHGGCWWEERPRNTHKGCRIAGHTKTHIQRQRLEEMSKGGYKAMPTDLQANQRQF